MEHAVNKYLLKKKERSIKLCLNANLYVSNRMSNVTHDGTSQFVEVSYWLKPNISSSNVIFPPPRTLRCTAACLYSVTMLHVLTSLCRLMTCAKKKATFSLEQAMKVQAESRGMAPLSCLFNLGVRWWWVVNATPWPLYPRERPSTHGTGGWMGPSTDLDGCGKFHPTGIRSPDRPARSEVLHRLRYSDPHTDVLTLLLLCSALWLFIKYL